jgi:signal transduction histidine kinase
MTRNVYELTKVEYGLRGHITSLNPIRAENAPDPWEAKALRAFEKGEREISSIEEIESQEFMRLMSPLITEKKCLKCHAKQGYQEGDIRGGISVSVPMGPLRAIAHKNEVTLVIAHVLLWLAGLAGGGLGAWRLKESKRTHESDEKAYTRLEKQSALLAQSEKKLEASNQQLRANEQQLQSANRDLGERVKELNCLYGLAEIVEQLNITLPEILRDAVNLLPPAWHYPEITCGRVIYDNDEFKTDNFKETQWSQSADIKISGEKRGVIEVFYLEHCRQLDEGPFLKEERDLIDALAERVSRIIERIRAEEKVKASEQQLCASNQQLTANEQQLHTEITDRKQAEENLQKAYAQLEEQSALLAQSEKTVAIGTLVAGTAHELNNPLTAVLNFSAHCRKHTSKDDELYPVLEDIEHEAKRCADIVRNLATFSDIGQDDDVYEKASLAKIIGRVFELLSWRIENEGISTTLDVAEDTPDIWMNTTAVQQLILNLTNNALDALKDSDKKELNVDVSRQGEFVRMTFADTGCGIEDGSLKSIFDPFFTTKPVGQRVGLGLSACQGIVKTHGGEITCESQPGAGMKFIILLPIERSKQNE